MLSNRLSESLCTTFLSRLSSLTNFLPPIFSFGDGSRALAIQTTSQAICAFADCPTGSPFISALWIPNVFKACDQMIKHHTSIRRATWLACVKFSSWQQLPFLRREKQAGLALGMITQSENVNRRLCHPLKLEGQKNSGNRKGLLPHLICPHTGMPYLWNWRDDITFWSPDISLNKLKILFLGF